MIEDKNYSWLKIEKYIKEKTQDIDYNRAENSNLKPFAVIMPPPNVTGSLHLGHALVTTLQDISIRYKRMTGHDCLWQAGLDHAGIATQMIVEKQLAQQNIKKLDLTKEQFIQKVYKWKEEAGSKILHQIDAMGGSYDKSYIAFTMDEQSTKGVNKAFVELYNKGIIYRDYRLVNWDCKLKTAISDLEVVQKEVKSHMYQIRYKVVDMDDYLIIATTRPETLFGDTALAVNPHDKRYGKYIGQFVYIPIIDRIIPVIADDYPDPNKGTGVVKITPAHDFNDFDVGCRHNLTMISIIDEDGLLNENVPSKYQGLSMKKARLMVIDALDNLGALLKIEDYTMSVPYGDRSDSIIEPLLTKQWFVDAAKLADPAIAAVQKKDIIFLPRSWENLYFDWMKNIKPWCISRQLWWGHRIPVWYTVDGAVIVAESQQEAQDIADKKYGYNISITQDPDVLDTWFSSSLWPFLTLGWPKDSEKIQRYYPTDVLITAFDIIFFWVARMIMMSLFFTKKVPFRKIYIHGLILDHKGQKMSKSKGNVVDPLLLMEQYGTDALRFSLAIHSTNFREIRFSDKNVKVYRNFITKIWNSFKFCQNNNMYISNEFQPAMVKLNINMWILTSFSQLQNVVSDKLENYKYGDAAFAIYHWIWDEFCDWYLEFSKVFLYDHTHEAMVGEIRSTMGFIWDRLLKLLHPFIPFISSYLYEVLHNNPTVVLSWESIEVLNLHSEKNKVVLDQLDTTIIFVKKIRAIRKMVSIPASSLIKVYTQDVSLPYFLKNNLALIKKLARIASVSTMEKPNESVISEVIDGKLFSIPLEGLIDLENELKRLRTQVNSLEKELNKLDLQLNNKNFIDKAALHVIENMQDRKKKIRSDMEALNTIVNQLSKN